MFIDEMKITFCLASLLSLFLVACSPDSTEQPAPVPPVPTGPLMPAQQAAAIVEGKTIVEEAFSLLSSNLQSAIASGGVTNALPYCSLAASPLTASIAERHGVTLQRVSHKPRNPGARADAVEQHVLGRFEAQLAIGVPLEPLATNVIVGQATFFAPIVLNNELCLNCHGVPGQDIQPETLAVIRELYPQDEATGFRLGELRGAWRVDMPLGLLAQSTSGTNDF
jgi:hypothetical protein